MEKIKKVELETSYYNALIDENPASIAMLDKEGNYLKVSERWQNDFIKYPSSLVGENHFTLFPIYAMRWKSLFKAAIKGQSQHIEKETITRKNGDIEVFRAEISSWHTPEGAIGGVIVVVHLITEQLKGRDLLRKASSELELAKKIGKIATWEYDVETGYFKWEGYEHIQGFKSGDKLDFKQVMKFIDESYHPEIYQLQSNAIKHGLPFSIVHPFKINEKKFWFHNRGKVEYTDQNKMKVVGLIQDITNQVDAERMYENQNIELKKINHELDKFVYKTAHDLRAPLTNIAGLISIMRGEKDPRMLNTYFDLQLQSVQRLDNFIQKITNYTKNKRLPLVHKQVDIRPVLDDILSSYYFVENFDKIGKLVSFQSEAEFYTDEERLRIILTNAISNSIKFADFNKPEPRIEIRFSVVGSMIKIVIWDNGVGINSKYMPRVFDMFYRATNFTEGSGIGLYILKETVESLDGKVELESKFREFTEISIYLPNHNEKS